MSSFTADRFAVPHAPLRTTIAIVVLLIVAGDALGNFLHSYRSLPHWFDLIINGVAFAAFGCWAVRLLFQLVRRLPILEASPEGIQLHLYSGNLFIPWPAVEAMTIARLKWMRIRLRPGAQPQGSIFARWASAALWQRRTVAVPLLTAAPSAESIVEDLRRAQARFIAAGAKPEL